MILFSNLKYAPYSFFNFLKLLSVKYPFPATIQLNDFAAEGVFEEMN
jgi:hypothetical protein